MKLRALAFVGVAAGALLGCDRGSEKTRRHDALETETIATATPSAATPRSKLVLRVDLAAIRVERGSRPELLDATSDAAARPPSDSIPKLAAMLSPFTDLFAEIDPEVSMGALAAIANTARAAGLSELRLMPIGTGFIHQVDLTVDPARKGKHVTLFRLPGNDFCDSMRDDPVAPMRRPVYVHAALGTNAPVRNLITIMDMASRCGISEVHVLLDRS